MDHDIKYDTHESTIIQITVSLGIKLETKKGKNIMCNPPF